MHICRGRFFILSNSRSINFVIGLAIVFNAFDSVSLSLATAGDNRSQVHELNSGSTLNWQQITGLLRADETADAVAKVQGHLSAISQDSLDGSLLATLDQPANRSFNVEYYRGASEVVASTIRAWRNEYPDAWKAISFAPQIRTIDKIKQTSLASPIVELKEAVDESRLTELRNLALVRLSDAYRLRGQFAAARAALERLSPTMRSQLPNLKPVPISRDRLAIEEKGGSLTNRGSVPWYLAVKLLSDADLETVITAQVTIDKLKQHFSKPNIGSDASTPGLNAYWPDSNEAFQRLVDISIGEGDLHRAGLELRLLEILNDKNILRVQPEQIESYRNTIARMGNSKANSRSLENDSIVELFDSLERQSGEGGSQNSRVEFTLGTPIWSKPLRAINATVDATAANLPRVAESNDQVLAYQPVVHEGRLFFNLLDQIASYDLESGKNWPATGYTQRSKSNGDSARSSSLPVSSLFHLNDSFDSAEYLKTPTVGVPRGRLIIDGSSLYARVGGQVTGWHNASGTMNQSSSQIIGLDLNSEGKMRRGFPLRLDWNEYPRSEWEGQPVVDDKRLYALVTKRDRVQIERFVLCFDRWTGALIWRSHFLAATMPQGLENANLIGQTQLQLNCDRLYCVTNLGAVVSLDKDTGKILWATKYPQTETSVGVLAKRAFPKSMRFRFRDHDNLLIEKSLLICMPRDCEEIFALDWATGELIWSTQPQTCSDLKHIVGVKSGDLICAGDRLVWIELETGRIKSGFPDSIQRKPDEPPRSLRGRGKPELHDDLIFFPVEGRVLVMPANVNDAKDGQISPIAEIQMGLRGESGMQIDLVGEIMVCTTPSRILAYDIQPQNWRRLDRSSAYRSDRSVNTDEDQ